MAKQSPFQALVNRQLDDEPSASISPDLSQPMTPVFQSGSQSGDQSPTPRRGKSSSPEFQRLTVYLRRDTILDLKRRIAGTGVELSDIVQDAVDLWARRGS